MGRFREGDKLIRAKSCGGDVEGGKRRFCVASPGGGGLDKVCTRLVAIRWQFLFESIGSLIDGIFATIDISPPAVFSHPLH